MRWSGEDSTADVQGRVTEKTFKQYYHANRGSFSLVEGRFSTLSFRVSLPRYQSGGKSLHTPIGLSGDRCPTTSVPDEATQRARGRLQIP